MSPVSLTTAIAVYFLIWWLTLFAVLPWGVSAQGEGRDTAPGTDPGAPVLPAIGRKLLWTTLVSALIFAACYFVYTRRLITLEDFAPLFGPAGR